MRVVRWINSLLLVGVLFGGWNVAVFAGDAPEIAVDDGHVALYDPTMLSQVLLFSEVDGVKRCRTDLPIAAVVVGNGKREFLLGKKWYGIGDIVLGRWVVDDISYENLVLRLQDDRSSVWTIGLSTDKDLVIKSYR